MSDDNRIVDLKKPDGGGDVPLNFGMSNEPGFVKMTFDPPVLRMRMKPREARTIAIAMLQHAEMAENPPSLIQPIT